ncbi:hypothetical protein [Methanoculleus chikugoensis]|uniref:Uncharacterized protein n=1 Tax=Methanoculleus chikugoensis TaxID=118126 RepID=A0ABM7H396_9EURY|nr:hypothetical protein [Methanoculleus chikugoensis]BBL67195.1 hypothetical protein MchiMG62_03760 [Methanoculleus chikugoensis]
MKVPAPPPETRQDLHDFSIRPVLLSGTVRLREGLGENGRMKRMTMRPTSVEIEEKP